MLVDVHAHLDDKSFSDDLDEVIERARKAGVKVIITNGLNPESNRKCLELAKSFDIVKCCLGLYPQDAEKLDEKQLDEELTLIEKNKNNIIAIGEVGLDYHWTKKEEKEKIIRQKKAFEKLIELSEKLNIPVIVHSRKAEQDCIEILENSYKDNKKKTKKIIMHCFGGNKKLVEQVINNKWFFSIPPNIVRSRHFQMIVKQCPLNQLLTETDAPYLSPYPEKRNEPAFITETIKKIAEIKAITPEETEKNIFMNYQRLFTE